MSFRVDSYSALFFVLRNERRQSIKSAHHPRLERILMGHRRNLVNVLEIQWCHGSMVYKFMWEKFKTEEEEGM